MHQRPSVSVKRMGRRKEKEQGKENWKGKGQKTEERKRTSKFHQGSLRNYPKLETKVCLSVSCTFEILSRSPSKNRRPSKFLPEKLRTFESGFQSNSCAFEMEARVHTFGVLNLQNIRTNVSNVH